MDKKGWRLCILDWLGWSIVLLVGAMVSVGRSDPWPTRRIAVIVAMLMTYVILVVWRWDRT